MGPASSYARFPGERGQRRPWSGSGKKTLTAAVSAPSPRPEVRTDAVAGRSAESGTRDRPEPRPPAPVPSAPASSVPVSTVPPPAAPLAAASVPAEDATQAIVNDPLVKRAVELFGARIVHVEPWKKQ